MGEISNAAFPILDGDTLEEIILRIAPFCTSVLCVKNSTFIVQSPEKTGLIFISSQTIGECQVENYAFGDDRYTFFSDLRRLKKMKSRAIIKPKSMGKPVRESLTGHTIEFEDVGGAEVVVDAVCTIKHMKGKKSRKDTAR